MRIVDDDSGAKTLCSRLCMRSVDADSGAQTVFVLGSVCELWMVTLMLRLFQTLYARCRW